MYIKKKKTTDNRKFTLQLLSCYKEVVEYFILIVQHKNAPLVPTFLTYRRPDSGYFTY